MGHLVAEPQLVDGCSGVTAADDGNGIGVCQCLRNGKGAFCGGRVLEDAHGTVPDDRSGFGDFFCEDLGGLRTDVEAHAVGRDGVGVNDIDIDGSVDRIGEGLRDDGVERKDDLHVVLRGLQEHLTAVFELRVVDQRLADLAALGLDEGVGHAAADDEGIGFGQKVLDDVELVRDLGAAEDGDEGSLRVFDRIAEIFDLFGNEIAGNGFIHIVDYADGGAVGAMGRAERVVDEHVCERTEFLGERGFVLGLFRSVTGVLKDFR